MVKIDQGIIDDIRRQSDIVSVISNYLPVVHKGNSYKCVCPFHDDHDPSLSISPTKQIYKCFVCGAAGNVFSFVQNFENVSFLESVKRVAEISNLPFDYSIERQARVVDINKKNLYNTLEEANDFLSYQIKLASNKEYYDYLINRGLTKEIITKFKIGYNPKNDQLTKFLLSKGYKIEDLNAINVSNQNYDVFTNRITFPLFNEYGNVVGFSARSLEEGQAKYINSATNEIYHKSKLVYNYHLAKSSCQKNHQVIVCEGVMDVIAYARVKIDHCVATLGTAVTNEQIKLIRQLSPNICVGYDGDKAGLAATYRFGKLASKMGIQINVLDNKTDLDPDEIIEKYSAEELVLLSKRTINWMEFLFRFLQKELDLKNYSQKEKFAKEIVEELKLLNDKTQKEYFLNQLNELTKFNLKVDNNRTVTKLKKIIKRDSELESQYEIINQMIKSKDAVEVFLADLGYLPNPSINRLAILIINAYKMNLKVDVGLLYSMVEDSELESVLGDILEYDLLQPNLKIDVLNGSINNLKSLLIKRKIEKIDIEMGKTFDNSLKSQMQEEKIELIKEELKYKTMAKEKR